MEEWKNIIGYEGLYEVSNMGNVRNVRRNTKNEIRDITRNIRKNYMKRIKKEIKSGEKIIETNLMSGRENID